MCLVDTNCVTGVYSIEIVEEPLSIDTSNVVE